RRRHTRCLSDWSSDVCSSDLEYVVKGGDVLQRVAHKTKTTPELIMRMNNMSSTMLHIGEHLLISHPDFAIVVQRKKNLLTLLNRSEERRVGKECCGTRWEEHC